MDIQICQQCNLPMETSGYDTCWTCWRGSQGYKRIKSDDRYDELQKIIHLLLQDSPDISHLEDQVALLNAYILQLKIEISNLRYQLEQKPKSAVSSDLIKELLIFCHPDKNHDRENEAEELTKTLLALRQKNEP